MSYKDIINGFQPIEYSKYKDINSDTKLMLYAAMKLKENEVPITFNYLCVATYKLFPDKFCLDEEFREFPSVDRLNRTYMHCKYVKNKAPYLAGDMEDSFSLTSSGLSIAKEVEAIMNNTTIDPKVKAPVVDKHKSGFSRDYIKFIQSKGFTDFVKTGKIDDMFLWEFYNITPYTQLKTVKTNLNNILNYAEANSNEQCVLFVNELLKNL